MFVDFELIFWCGQTMMMLLWMAMIVHDIGAKLVSNWVWNMLYTKSLKTLCKKRISILTDLKASSLAFKCGYYRLENNAKERTHGIEFCKSLNAKMEYTNW